MPSSSSYLTIMPYIWKFPWLDLFWLYAEVRDFYSYKKCILVNFTCSTSISMSTTASHTSISMLETLLVVLVASQSEAATNEPDI